MKFFSIIFLLSLSSASVTANPLIPTDVLVNQYRNGTQILSGNSAGIGADTIDPRYLTAWFYGNRTITTCFQYIDAFGVEEEKVKLSVKRSLRIWGDYLSQRLTQRGLHGVNTNFQLKGRCRGGEDLRLHFGTGPIFGNLRDLKTSQSLGQPLAYLNKTHLAKDLKWSRGYIRFVPHGYYRSGEHPFPNWQTPGALDAMVIHELGHVLGFLHVEGTIMDGDLAGIIAQRPKTIEVPRIDLVRELLPCGHCSYTFKAKFSDLKQEIAKSLVVDKQQKDIRLEQSPTGFVLSTDERSFVIENLESEKLNKKTIHLSNYPESNIVGSDIAYFGSIDNRLGVTLIPTVEERGWRIKLNEFGRFLTFGDFIIPEDASEVQPQPEQEQEGISILQDVLGIECEVTGSSRDTTQWKTLKMERRDQLLELISKKKKKLRYRHKRFMDRSVLLEGDQDHLLFDILPDGDIYAIKGKLISFREKNCADTGASKECFLKDLGLKLHWSAEQVKLVEEESGFLMAGGEVQHYGIFPQDATYFLSRDRKGEWLGLIDFGAPFSVIYGEKIDLRCRYDQP